MFRLETQKQFDEWLDDKDLRLMRFFASIPPELLSYLDFSLDSLKHLETWLLQKYPEVQRDLSVNELAIIDTIGTYVGEVFRKYLGGQWVIDLENEENAYFGIPGIGNFGGNHSIKLVYPSTWVTTSIHRRTGTFIYNLVEKFSR
ncbi:MAG: hypothetical protein IPK17_15885 [Chloroflexi bacterium]|uniref:hypothetical protein n=1 Tax=Candidatus Flexifilum breve TaxID=3140694 RepID=UPI003135C438|nr:hypothetical protein [Chloroflexota bacterium]